MNHGRRESVAHIRLLCVLLSENRAVVVTRPATPHRGTSPASSSPRLRNGLLVLFILVNRIDIRTNLEQNVIYLHLLIGLYLQFRDFTGVVGDHVVQQLHGGDDAEDLALRDLVAFLHVNLGNRARQRGYHGLRLELGRLLFLRGLLAAFLLLLRGQGLGAGLFWY